jgi:hypothetical protein
MAGFFWLLAALLRIPASLIASCGITKARVQKPRILSNQGRLRLQSQTLCNNSKTFIQAHWDVLAAIDFTTIEVWTKSGLSTFYLLFVMELSTRRVEFAGCTTNPEDGWMMLVGRTVRDR